MNPPRKRQVNTPDHLGVLAFACAGLAWLGLGTLSAHAQTAITSWTLTTDGIANITKYTGHPGGHVNFENDDRQISGFTAGGVTYQYYQPIGFGGATTYIRRNTDAGDTAASNIWSLNGNGVANIVDGRYHGNLNHVLGNDNLNNGAENLFVNGANSSGTPAGNIERVDFHWSSGVVVGNYSGITVFERGPGDLVQIAVFTGWNSVTDRPTTYGGNVVSLSGSSFSSPNTLDLNPGTAGVQGTSAYNVLRFNDGDITSESHATLLSNTYTASGQGIVGSFVSFASLGIAAGTTIYGYSLMSTDVTNNIGDLADWTNATFYPTNTNTANGGIDLVGFNGVLAAPVPEPSTYGAILMGVSLAGWLVRKRLQRNTV